MAQLTTGDIAPDFELPTAAGGSIKLSDLRGSGVVVFFFPAALTPGCTREACDFQSAHPDLTVAGYQVVGVSPDPVERLAKFAAQEGLTYTLASDSERGTLDAYGAWGERTLYGKTIKGVIRSTVVVDPQGHVELALYNVRASGHVDRLSRELGLP
jgi:thioredoxin-dependent peroxiredoxin